MGYDPSSRGSFTKTDLKLLCIPHMRECTADQVNKGLLRTQSTPHIQTCRKKVCVARLKWVTTDECCLQDASGPKESCLTGCRTRVSGYLLTSFACLTRALLCLFFTVSGSAFFQGLSLWILPIDICILYWLAMRLENHRKSSYRVIGWLSHWLLLSLRLWLSRQKMMGWFTRQVRKSIQQL